MNRQKKQTIIILIVLLVLVGGYFLLTKFPISTEEEDTTEKIMEMSRDDVSYIEFEGTDGTLKFTRSDDGWILEGYEDRTVDSSTVSAAISSCINITLETKLEDVTDYSMYGLTEPSRIVYFSAADGDHTVKFGDYNTTSSVYYMMVDDDPTVYVYGHSSTLPFDHEAEYYLEEVDVSDDDISADDISADDVSLNDVSSDDISLNDVSSDETEVSAN